MGFETAVIFCAGQGERMRPLTLNTPKPLLTLGGQPVLARLLERLADEGVERVVVNAHHLAPQIEAFCQTYPQVRVVREAQLLDTGGALRAMAAAGLLPEGPFYVLNGDTTWVDGPSPALRRLREGFDPARHDALLLLARTAGAVADTGLGDFVWPRDGALARRGERDVAPFCYAGVQVMTRALLAADHGAVFSVNRLWDDALARGRLGAIIHDGVWFHLSTPEGLALAEEALAALVVGNAT
ncbi:nucleotidyltransferase family protein [Acidocella sp.]|uniref:nucleotidyltransferase family protein n=1 Tax=Acidocella sp. TaxID=50710 RepID=UPI00260FBA34|nr:nucleotidyltransferase family protein [Acidocella sp.]